MWAVGLVLGMGLWACAVRSESRSAVTYLKALGLTGDRELISAAAEVFE